MRHDRQLWAVLSHWRRLVSGVCPAHAIILSCGTENSPVLRAFMALRMNAMKASYDAAEKAGRVPSLRQGFSLQGYAVKQHPLIDAALKGQILGSRHPGFRR